MGLIWSQSPWTRPAASPSTIPSPSRWSPGPGAPPAHRSGQVHAAPGRRGRDAPGRARARPGRHAVPAAGAAPGSHPAVLILNGSGGGINEPRAALYASRGYAAFALAYFKAPGLSDYISTPAGILPERPALAARQGPAKHDFVAVSGQSRGGELVLLLGATFPTEVSAVVAYVPGAVVHSGQNACDPKIGREGPTWLLGGKPLPHVWENNRTATWAPFDEGPRRTATKGHPHRPARPRRRGRARIRSRTSGPGRAAVATDDGSWPSSLYSKMVRDKLTEVDHPIPSGGWITERRPLHPVPLRAHHPAGLRPPRVRQDQHQRRQPQGQRPRRPGILGRRADVPGRGGEGAGKRWPRPPVRAAQRRRRHGQPGRAG